MSSDTRPVPLETSEESLTWREKLTVLRARAILTWTGHKSARMTLLQTAGAGMALVGLALFFSAPIALIVGGIGAIVVAERQ
jgi:hypothetical protein